MRSDGIRSFWLGRGLASSGDVRERWQKFVEEAETWLLDVIFEQRPGKKAAAARLVLLLLSKGFAFAVRARRLLYNVRILRDATLGVRSSRWAI